MEKNWSKQALIFINSLKNDNGSYSFSKKSSCASCLSTSFALLALEVLQQKNLITDDSVSYILKHQNNDGLFYDSIIEKNNKNQHDYKYISHQITYHAIMVCDMLNIELPHNLVFLKEYKDKAYLKSWLENLNWKNPWLVSNNIMFILYFFIYEQENYELENEIYIQTIIEWLIKNQSNNTGYWDCNNKSSLHNQMAGAFHFLFFFDYLGINIQHKEEIINSTLLIQEYDGLYSYASGGGSCDDLDGIDILCRLFNSGVEKNKIRKSLLKSYNSLTKNQNYDGGFCWAKRRNFNWKNIIHIIPLRLILKRKNIDAKNSFFMKNKNIIYSLLFKQKLTWCYSGIKDYKIYIDDSDIFSTWFRVLSLTLIEKTLDNKNNIIREKCGIGFFKKC